MINPDLIVKHIETEQDLNEQVPFIDILPGALSLRLSKASGSLLNLPSKGKGRVVIVRDYINLDNTVIGVTDVASVHTATDGRYNSALVSLSTATMRSAIFCQILIKRFNLDADKVKQSGARFYLTPTDIDGIFSIDINYNINQSTVEGDQSTDNLVSANTDSPETTPAEAGITSIQ